MRLGRSLCCGEGSSGVKGIPLVASLDCPPLPPPQPTHPLGAPEEENKGATEALLQPSKFPPTFSKHRLHNMKECTIISRLSLVADEAWNAVRLWVDLRRD